MAGSCGIPEKLVVIPGDQAVWDTLKNQASLARLEQLIAMMRGACFLQAVMAKHVSQPRGLPSQSKLCW